MSSVAHEPHTITRAGHMRLTAELERLVAERPRLAAEVRHQRTDANNAAEHENLATAVAAQAALDRRIEDLRSALATAQIAAEPADGIAALGQTVTLRFDGGAEEADYELVGALESDPRARRLSVQSPIGQALLGTRVGETIEVAAPAGARRVHVVAIEPTLRAAARAT
jgi:transcription elongation factor GreA